MLATLLVGAFLFETCSKEVEDNGNSFGRKEGVIKEKWWY